MLKIDNSLLEELGLGSLPDGEKNSLLRHIYETLEMRVGMRLADQMTNEQLDEFEQYFEAKDDAGAFKWLETNFPNYKDIVQEEFDKLKAEVGQSSQQILAASQANAQNPQQATEQPMQGPNSQLPQQPAELSTPPQVAPAPAQPYAAPPVSSPAPMPEPSSTAGPQPFSPPPSNWQPPQQQQAPPVSDTPQQ